MLSSLKEVRPIEKVYQQELEELQRLKQELIKKNPELAQFEEIEIPLF